MKITGIIVEYNPLHNGHLYHINETKKRSNCDFLVAVMSGNFVQRGEPAIVNKYIRTELALLSGVDLVIELPYLYAVQSADLFAYGAIKLLNELQVEDIYFGSETDDPVILTKVAHLLGSDAFQEAIKFYLKQGFSYPKASELALNKLSHLNYQFNSNDILAIQYIRSILKINPTMKYHTIKRLHNQYNDYFFSHESIASATSIRKALINEQAISNYVPSYTKQALSSTKLVSWDDFFPYLKYIVNVNRNHLHTIHDVNEGIENAIRSINHYHNFTDFVTSLTSKRYTESKIKRILTHILNNITKEEITKMKPYIRILGMNQTKSGILKTIKQKATIPVITNIDKEHYELIKLDERVSETYHLIDLKPSRKIPVITNNDKSY